MSANPKMQTVPDADWRTFLRQKGVKSWYSFIVPPRAYWDTVPDTIFVKMSCRFDTSLLGHELGHAVDFPDNDHGAKFWGCLAHAVRVGFDTRAFTSLLRLVDNPELMEMAYRWMGALPQ